MGWLSTDDLLIKLAGFAMKVNNILYIKGGLSKLVIPRRSPVLSLPFR